MLITNIEMIPGRQIVQHHGLVSGSTVRAKHVGRDIMAGLKNIFGGELKGYTELLTESPDPSWSSLTPAARKLCQSGLWLLEQAKQMGANAIVNVRFSTSSVAAGAAELYVYGTAVTVR